MREEDLDMAYGSFYVYLSDSDDGQKHDEELCVNLVQILNKVLDQELLIKFVRTFLLESNITSIRWQAHSLIHQIYKYGTSLYLHFTSIHMYIYFLYWQYSIYIVALYTRSTSMGPLYVCMYMQYKRHPNFSRKEILIDHDMRSIEDILYFRLPEIIKKGGIVQF